MSFELARTIADSVLYEGYVLYPYRASSAKNQFRWQFGIVAPRAWSEVGGEAWQMQTECLVEPQGSPLLEISVRFLRVRVRQSPGEPAWDEGVEQTFDLHRVSLESLLQTGIDQAFDLPASRTEEDRPTGRVMLEQFPISARVIAQAETAGSLLKFRVRIENMTPLPDAATAVRDDATRRSLLGAHTLLSITNGAFVSLMDPPESARAAAKACTNLHTWPVLVGRPGTREVMLSSPIILQDYPAIAPESQGDFFDATEIDEMLTLRVMTLTPEEKQEACATDDRARRIIERCDNITPERMEQLHGAGRPVEDFFNPQDEVPEEASIELDAGSIQKGSQVRLAPKRNSDTMDFFLAGRTAHVQAIHRDVENQVYVAVTVDDDPAADLHGKYNRFFYFYPDEVELLEQPAKEN